MINKQQAGGQAVETRGRSQISRRTDIGNHSPRTCKFKTGPLRNTWSNFSLALLPTPGFHKENPVIGRSLVFLRGPVLEFTAAERTVFPMSALRLFAVLRFRCRPSGCLPYCVSDACPPACCIFEILRSSPAASRGSPPRTPPGSPCHIHTYPPYP